MADMPSKRALLAELIAQDDDVLVDGLHVDDLQELRLALVMSGGVSLAVWMGGAALEFDRVIRCDDRAYLELLRLTRSIPRIDVIAGTSAGGLNGALLAYAITQETGIAGLRKLWLELGALEKLLRQPTADPASLMRGDDYFLPQLEKALRKLTGSATEPEEVPMELIITATLLKPWPRGVSDSFGTVIQDADHRGEFSFRRGTSLSEDDPTPDDDFAAPNIVSQLALAARSTASFPMAFEPSYIPIGTQDGSRADMSGIANFQRSRFVIDGGVLLNRPLRPALRAIFRQQAAKQVRRVLAYVVPDPGEAMAVDEDKPSDAPSLGAVTAASIVRLPRNQSVTADLDELMLHNARVDAQHRRRELVVSKLDVDALADAAYPQYRTARADVIASWLLGVLARGFTALELQERSVDPAKREITTEAPLRERGELRARLLAHLESLPPERFPGREQEAAQWFTTVDTAERAATVVLDVLRRGLAVLDPSAGENAELRGEMRSMRETVSKALTDALATRARLERDQELALARDAVLALREDQANAGQTGGTALRSWAEATLPRVLGAPEKLAPIVARIADQLQPAAAATLRACEAATEHLKPTAGQTRRYVEDLVAHVGDEPQREVTPLRRLLAIEVAQVALGGQPVVEQHVDLIQVSADAGNGLDPREHAEDKLAGLQVAHFGAFYKRSWRANDWMWGRHDAAQRLAQVLLDPARLRQLGRSAGDVVAVVERVAFGELGEDDAKALREATPRRWDADTARTELAFLGDDRLPVPATLPMCAQAVARRIQFGILRDELPNVRAAIAADGLDGAHMSTEARDFVERLDGALAQGNPLSAADAIALFGACRVGEERITEETGSDLLARTATRSVAVGASALSGQASGLPKVAQRPTKTLRGLALMVYLVVRYALEGSRTGAMIVTAGLFAGAAFVAVGLLVDIPGLLMVFGLGAILATVLLTAWRGNFAAALGALVLGLLIALLPKIGDWTWDSIGHDDVDRWQPVFVVAGLLVAAFILGMAGFAWPEPDELEPGAGDAASPSSKQRRAPHAPLGSAFLTLGVLVGGINELVDWVSRSVLVWIGAAGVVLVGLGTARLWSTSSKARAKGAPDARA